MRSIPSAALIVLALAVLPGRDAHSREPVRKPAVLFLSRRIHMNAGGAYLRRNMARLDGLGYRVAYYSYADFYGKDPGLVQSFDVVVMLDVPGIDWSGTREPFPETQPPLPHRAASVLNMRRA